MKERNDRPSFVNIKSLHNKTGNKSHNLKSCCWFIVESTQYRQYIDLPSLMVVKLYKPPSIRIDFAP